MSFSNLVAGTDRKQALLLSPPTWNTRDGDAKYIKDCGQIQDTVRTLELHAADVRKETSILGTAYKYMGSRNSVQEAITKSRVSAENARLSLEGLSAQKVESKREQSRRKLEEQKLKEDLTTALKKLDKAWEEYAITDAGRLQRTKAHQQSAMAGLNSSAATFSSGRIGGSVGVEMPAMEACELGLAPCHQAQPVQMQDQAQEVSAEQADIHCAIVGEYAEQISSLNQDMRSLQRCMLDLASETQEQGVSLDSIEASMSLGVTQTQSASQEIVQSSKHQLKGFKWICRLLALALVLASIIIFIVSHRS